MADSNPNRHREQKLKKRYGITEADYNTLLEKQGGKCAICGNFRKLVVDHCHTKGNVRSLICSQCNSGLGLFGDNPTTLRLAAEYVERDTERFCEQRS